MKLLIARYVLFYGVYFGLAILGYWLLCLGFGWDFNIFVPLGIGVLGIFVRATFRENSDE